MKLCVFDRSRGQEEGEEAEKILFFFPTATPLQEQVTLVGLWEGLLAFSSLFAGAAWPCELVEGQRHQHVFYQCERPSIFMVLVIDDAQDGLSKQFRVALGASRMDDPRNSLGSPGLSTSSAGANSNSAYGHSASASATWYRKGVRDGALRGFLQEAYHLFCLFYGPLPQLIRAIGVRTARRCLAAFLPDFLTDGLASTTLAATSSPFTSPYSVPSAITLSRAAAKRIPGLADNLKEAQTAQSLQRLYPQTMLHALSLLAQLGHSGTGMASAEGPGPVGMVLYKDELVATTIPPVEAAAVYSYAKARLVPASTRPSGSASLFNFASLQPRAPTPPRSASTFFNPRSSSPSQPSRGAGGSGTSSSSTTSRQYSHRPTGPPGRTRERPGGNQPSNSSASAAVAPLHPPASLFPSSRPPSTVPAHHSSVSSTSTQSNPAPTSPTEPSSPTSPHSVPFPPFPLTSPPRPLAQQCWTRDTDGFAVSSEAWGKDEAGLPVGPTVQMGWGASARGSEDPSDGALPGHEREGTGPVAGAQSAAHQSGAGSSHSNLGRSSSGSGGSGSVGESGSAGAGGRDGSGNAGEEEEGVSAAPGGRTPRSSSGLSHTTTTMFLRACHSGSLTLVLCTPAGQQLSEGPLSPRGLQQQGQPQLHPRPGQQSHLVPTVSLQHSASDSSRFWTSLQELQKLLDSVYPGPLHTHVKGHRYLAVDTLASLSVASPAVKVGTLRRESLLLLNQMRWEVDHQLHRARVTASPLAVQQRVEKRRRRRAEASAASGGGEALSEAAPSAPASELREEGGRAGAGTDAGAAAAAAETEKGSGRETAAQRAAEGGGASRGDSQGGDPSARAGQDAAVESSSAPGAQPQAEQAEGDTGREEALQGSDSDARGGANALQEQALGPSESTGGLQGTGRSDGGLQEPGYAGLLQGASEEMGEVYSRVGQSVWGAASSSWDGRRLYSVMERGADSLVGAQEAVEELRDRCSSLG